jgi:Regulator of ribonuclease activity B
MTKSRGGIVGGPVNVMSRDQGGKRGAPAIDPVKLALDQLRRAGTDPTVPHQTRHFIYVPGVKAAQNVARALKTPKRVVEIDTSARTGYWLVVIKQSMVVTSEAMAALKVEFEAAAAPVGGEYDRWQIDLDGG